MLRLIQGSLHNIKIFGGVILKKTVKGVVLTAALALAVTSIPMMGSAAAKTTIIITNGKGEIAAQWKAAAAAFSKANPDIEVQAYSQEVGDSLGPFDKLTKSGKVVTVAMVEPSSVYKGGKYYDIAAELKGTKWAEQTGDEAIVEGKVKGFPFAIEGFGIVFNRAVVEKAIGGKFNEKSIKTRAQLEDLIKKVQKSGVKFPVAYQTEAWSVGNHYISQFLHQGKGEEATLSAVETGKLKLAKNATFNGLLDTMDLLANPKYNLYGSRVLGQYYDQAHVKVGSGEAAFLFNGNWAYDSLKAQKGADYGFIAVPQDNNANNKYNGKMTAGPTQLLIVNKKASAAQQAAGKKFLDWIVFDKAGQDFLVNKSQVISAFKNNPYSVTNPLGANLASYIKAGLTVPFSTNYINAGDYFNIVGPAVQKYLAKKSSRTQLAKTIEDYHIKNYKKINGQ
jgi:raffinose/stachyose/melibiose transport system substrate-binding protein